MARALAGVLALAAFAGGAGRAHATYSITAVDTATGAVGGVGASCVPYEVIVIHVAAPGHGAANVQAGLNPEANETVRALLEDDTPPDEIVDAVTDAAFDAKAQTMQYGIVDVAGRSAAFTGPLAKAYASDRSGEVDDLVYTAQGNLLTSAAVLDRAGDAFEGEGCDLPDRLMRALEAAEQGDEGDNRCVAEGIPAKSAYLQVDLPDSTLVRISVPDVSPDHPVLALREQYDAWRVDHPCPAPEDAEPDGDPSDGDPGSAAASDTGCSVSSVGRGDARAVAVLLLGVVALARSGRRRRAPARPQ